MKFRTFRAAISGYFGTEEKLNPKFFLRPEIAVPDVEAARDLVVRRPSAKPLRGTLIAVAIATIGLVFLNTAAFRYLTVARETYGVFWPRRDWLFAHILAGLIALMLGPLQLWLGWNKRWPALHRVLGITYVITVAIGAAAAFHLARKTDFGWVFGLGLASMGVAWIITTALATIAICRKLIEQHREWVIRSYIVTFGFVTFRVVAGGLEVAHVGTLTERLAAASWICWAVPLMLAEVFLQGRKLFRRRPLDTIAG